MGVKSGLSHSGKNRDRGLIDNRMLLKSFVLGGGGGIKKVLNEGFDNFFNKK